uniref:Chitinase-3-like protein 1 n=1 Tax=Salvator merianae TaxID=96440 RepID=A0A8D0B0B6_SALMN
MGQVTVWTGCFVALIFLQFASAYKLVCFFTHWSQFRESTGRFVPANIDPNLCTHIIYAFTNIKANEIGSAEWNDASVYRELNGLKSRNPNLKILLSIGGYNLGSEPFRNVTESAATRSKFARSVILSVQRNNCDGIDIAWHISEQSDKHRLTELLQDLDSLFKREARKQRKEKLILSVSIPAGKEAIDKGYDIQKISEYVDFINFQTYDFHGSWESHTGHVSPLQKSSSDSGSASSYNVDFAVKYLKEMGAPEEKIIMGISTYGRSFTLASRQSLLGAPASGGGSAGAFTKASGMLAYYEICGFNHGAIKRWIDEQAVPYSYKGNQWVGYEDVKSVKIKVQYMKANNLGGITVWALDLDDFSGSFCNQGKYPLLDAIKKEMDKTI